MISRIFTGVVLTGLAALAAGCVSSIRSDLARLERELETTAGTVTPQTPAPQESELDDRLSQELTLAMLLGQVKARNPELQQASARAQAAMAEVRRSGALDDPRMTYEAREIPKSRPGDLGDADMTMISVMQDIPFPGNLSLRAEAALRDAEAMTLMVREKERSLIARAKKTYFDYFKAIRELEILQQHQKLLEEFESISEIRYKTGSVSQQDVLKPQVELTLLSTSIHAARQRIESIRSALNVLLNRPVTAPLGTPQDVPLNVRQFDMAELQTRAGETRAELKAAEFRIRAAESSLTLAEREATYPDFSVSVGYMDLLDRNDALQGMVSINLPWFTGKRSAEVEEKRHLLRMAEAERTVVYNQIMHEILDAYTRSEALRKSALLIQGELLPKSQQSVDVSRSGYEKEKVTFLDLLDAERSERDAKLTYYEILAEYESALAELEQAVGADLSK